MLKSLQPGRIRWCSPSVFHQKRFQSTNLQTKAAGKCSATENFDDIWKKRSSEAKRSIAIEIESDKFYNSAYHHGKQFGGIRTAFAYKLKDNRKFVLLEYDNEEAIQEIYKNASCKSNAVPWPNQFLALHSSYLASDQYQSSDTPLIFSSIAEPPIDQDLQNAANLEEQIWTLYEQTYPTELSFRLKTLRAKQIEQNIQQNLRFMLPNAKVMPFGPAMNGFGTMKSKMYLSVQCENDEAKNDIRRSASAALEFYGKSVEAEDQYQLSGAARQMKCIASALEYYIPNCSEFIAYPKARIPFFTFQDGDIECATDVCINNRASIKTTELMYVLGLLDARIRPFIFLIQQWVFAHSLSPLGKDKLSTTHINYMALCFLQQLSDPVLPTVADIYEQLKISDSDRLYQPIDLTQLKFQSNNNSSVAELFNQFLLHYISFDLESNMISLRTTEKIPKASEESSTICLENIFAANENFSENIDVDQLHTLLSSIQNTLNDWPQCQEKRTDGKPWGLLKLFSHLN